MTITGDTLVHCANPMGFANEQRYTPIPQGREEEAKKAAARHAKANPEGTYDCVRFGDMPKTQRRVIMNAGRHEDTLGYALDIILA